jgi:hypothetical protein
MLLEPYIEKGGSTMNSELSNRKNPTDPNNGIQPRQAGENSSTMHDTAAYIRHRTGKMARGTAEFVRKQPLASIGAAAVVGTIIGVGLRKGGTASLLRLLPLGGVASILFEGFRLWILWKNTPASSSPHRPPVPLSK